MCKYKITGEHNKPGQITFNSGEVIHFGRHTQMKTGAGGRVDLRDDYHDTRNDTPALRVPFFITAADHIEAVLRTSRDGQARVHCFNGNSRTAFALITYLVRWHGVDFKQACADVEKVQKERGTPFNLTRDVDSRCYYKYLESNLDAIKNKEWVPDDKIFDSGSTTSGISGIEPRVERLTVSGSLSPEYKIQTVPPTDFELASGSFRRGSGSFNRFLTWTTNSVNNNSANNNSVNNNSIVSKNSPPPRPPTPTVTTTTATALSTSTPANTNAVPNLDVSQPRRVINKPNTSTFQDRLAKEEAEKFLARFDGGGGGSDTSTFQDRLAKEEADAFLARFDKKPRGGDGNESDG